MSVDTGARAGRPRSEPARLAVLHAVDDLLVDVGYAAMTMKGIAQRAGVGRQTVYRWWSTKAEILLEACVTDAGDELGTPARPEPFEDVLLYLEALSRFLSVSPAGLAYRALVGEAQHDPVVRDLVQGADVLMPSARAVLDRVRVRAPGMPAVELAAAQLTGPVLGHVLTRPAPLSAEQLRDLVSGLLSAWSVLPR